MLMHTPPQVEEWIIIVDISECDELCWIPGVKW